MKYLSLLIIISVTLAISFSTKNSLDLIAQESEAISSVKEFQVKLTENIYESFSHIVVLASEENASQK